MTNTPVCTCAKPYMTGVGTSCGNCGRTISPTPQNTGKDWVDLTDEEKKAIALKAGREANEEQAAIVASHTPLLKD